MKKIYLFFTLSFILPFFCNAEILLYPDYLEVQKNFKAKNSKACVISNTNNSIKDIGAPSEVLVIINQNSEISIAIGEYYMQLRGIPDINLCVLDCSTTEVIKRQEFVGKISSPIREYLQVNGLKSRIKYFLTTKGVPLKITGVFSYDTYMSSVDSELTLLDQNYSLKGWYPNPYYGLDENLDRSEIQIYLVNRLTSYDIDEDSNNIPDDIESYLAKSQFPSDVDGRFILDTDAKKDGSGGYKIGNDWMRNAAEILTDMGANVFLEETEEFLTDEDDVIGYCSWGSNDSHAKNHGEPYFTWVDGSIATTYVSTNARTFKYPPEYGQSMIADMLREGITGIYGNVYEPYLTACANPEILFPRYYKGYNLSESYYMSLPFISWMEIVVGDPLCAPFAERIPRVHVSTNRVIYSAGDELEVNMDIWNTDEEISIKLYIALSMNGSLFFYPEWTKNIDYSELQLGSKSRLHLDILDIILPVEIDPLNLNFYAAITDPEGNLIGNLSSAELEFK